jgi:hypothetical protein
MEVEECALKKQVREYRRQAYKLYVYAPLSDVAFSERRARFREYFTGSIAFSMANRSRWPQAQESFSVVPDPLGFFF